MSFDHWLIISLSEIMRLVFCFVFRFSYLCEFLSLKTHAVTFHFCQRSLSLLLCLLFSFLKIRSRPDRETFYFFHPSILPFTGSLKEWFVNFFYPFFIWECKDNNLYHSGKIIWKRFLKNPDSIIFNYTACTCKICFFFCGCKHNTDGTGCKMF